MNYRPSMNGSAWVLVASAIGSVLGCTETSACPGCDGDAGGDPDAPSIEAPDTGAALGVPGDSTQTMPDFGERSFDVHVPASYDGVTPLPVILVLHGGGGNRASVRRTTCPGGDLASPECMDAIADERGFIVVYPDGTAGPIGRDLRTWNAGGGEDGWQCISAYACNENIDEAAYFTALLAHLATVVHFDPERVYATGHSNGAALAERLACELQGRIAGIAPVAGGNQYATTRPCSAATPVLEIHGTADPCWPFDGGEAACADPGGGAKIGVLATIAGWLTRNGCGTTRETTMLPDTTRDGTTVLRHVYDCPGDADVELYEVVDGGHSWPSGHAAGSATGMVSTDFSANRVMLEFFAAH
jgi:polyhydroxybutyrate depolymerase